MDDDNSICLTQLDFDGSLYVCQLRESEHWDSAGRFAHHTDGTHNWRQS